MKQILTPQFSDLFAPYLALRLSAFENLKVVVGVLAASHFECEAFEINKVSDGSLDSENSQSIYAVKWQGNWIVCGRSNGYQEPITLSQNDSLFDIDSARMMNVPILSLQQISFMCVETAHFDHC